MVHATPTKVLLTATLRPLVVQLAGPLAHYTFGASMAALYGALAARDERVTAGFGLAFGMLVWLLFDEVAIPALKLSPPPWESPAPVHARGVAAHVVYGPVTEAVRRALVGNQDN